MDNKKMEPLVLQLDDDDEEMPEEQSNNKKISIINVKDLKKKLSEAEKEVEVIRTQLRKKEEEVELYKQQLKSISTLKVMK